MMLARCFFFYDDTSTPEIYTYLHTLSLRYSLPILRRAAKADGVTPRGTRNSSRNISPGCVGGRWVGRLRWTSAPAPPIYRRRIRARCRSEEHTPELKSLMRISYAVF